ncbi:MAG: hypothetical protein SFU98_06935 [Leptospiraceae bacterium]|nr:hypothetical protein [Leptospiraceae bacterium]
MVDIKSLEPTGQFALAEDKIYLQVLPKKETFDSKKQVLYKNSNNEPIWLCIDKNRKDEIILSGKDTSLKCDPKDLNLLKANILQGSYIDGLNLKYESKIYTEEVVPNVFRVKTVLNEKVIKIEEANAYPNPALIRISFAKGKKIILKAKNENGYTIFEETEEPSYEKVWNAVNFEVQKMDNPIAIKFSDKVQVFSTNNSGIQKPILLIAKENTTPAFLSKNLFIVLMPLSLVADIVTSPIQAILYWFIFKDGNGPHGIFSGIYSLE